MSQDPAFERDGFKLVPQAVDEPALVRLKCLFGENSGAGTRLNAAALALVADLIGCKGPIGQIASNLCNRPAFVVRAISFDKQPDMNWSLDWHQDRTVNVSERIEVAGYSHWTVKQGLVHVEPPQDVIAAMLTLRVHLDDVPECNGPLRVLPNSHRLGRLREDTIQKLTAGTGGFSCLANRGDVWVYRTAILHASSGVADGQGHRRVLQLDYACDELPGPLQWAVKL